MTHLFAPQLVFLLSVSAPTAMEMAAEPFEVDLQCELEGVSQEGARAAIVAEVDEVEGLGVQAILVCGGPDEVIIHLTRDLQNASSSIDLSAFPASTRARALALAVAEAIPLLIPPSPAKVEAPEQTPAPPIAAPDPTPASPEASVEDLPQPRTLPSVQIHLGPTYRGYFGGDHQGGGKVSVAVNALEIGVHALAGKKDGGARGSHMGGQLGYDFLYRPYRPARPVLGLETNLGYSDSGDLSSGYGAGLVFVGWNGPLGNEWRATFRGETGYSFRGISGNVPDEASRFSGGFVGATFILGAAPEYREPYVYR